MIDLKRLMFDMSLTQNDLSNIIKESQSVVSNLANDKRPLLGRHIKLLKDYFGDRLDDYYIDDEVWRADNARPITGTILPADIVEEIKEEAREEAEQANILPYVSKDIVQARDTNIRRLVEEKSAELKYKALSEVFGDVDYVQKVITPAMMPTFQPGDLLFVKFLPDHAKIISGALYLIDTRLYGAMVRQVIVDGDTFRLTSTNPDFGPLEIHRTDVYSIGIVAHLVRSDFNTISEFPNLTQQMARRDNQIDSLIEQIDKAGEREHRLIKLLENKH